MPIGRACRICGRRIANSTSRCADCESQSYRHTTSCRVCGRRGPYGYCEEHYQEMLAEREAKSQARREDRQQWRKGYSDPNYHRERSAALARARRACERCGRSDLKLEIDHIVPLSRGGENVRGNLQVLCRMCHIAKTRGDRRR